MKHHLTIAYIKGRKDSKIAWFNDSLKAQIDNETAENTTVVIVDRHAVDDQPVITMPNLKAPKHLRKATKQIITPPKPNVWQGKYRLAAQDWFAPSNARNTAICLAPDGWIAFVDDISVLMPGWLNCIRQAMEGGYIVLGCYKKVKNLIVKKGIVESYEDYPAGVDSRIPRYATDKPSVAPGSDLYGCSFAMPVEAALAVNGFDEDCDSMGAEDTAFGWMLAHQGNTFMFDPRMMTLESEELHHVPLGGEPMPRRIIKPSRSGAKDASWDMVNMLHNGRKVAPNYFGPEGIRGLRRRVLAGEPFPIQQIPQHHWVDSQPISQM